MGHNIKLTGKRYQTSLGREFKPVYDEAKDMNSLVFATVVKVNYRFNTVDVVTTKNADSLVKPTATRGKLSARLPVTFGGSLSNGKPYGDFIPITEGDTVLIGFVDGLKDNPIVVNIYKDNATASNIAPFRAISGDPESGDLLQGALAYSKVYPYQTMEYTAGNGDHTHTFPGRTAFAVRSTTPTLQYTDITDEYNINPGVLPNGLPIDPTNTEKPQMFLTHRGTYDRDIINALWDTDSSFTMSRFNADLPEKSSFRIVDEKTILFQYNLDNLDNTKAKTAEIGIKDGVPTLSFGGHTLTMGKDGAEIDGISIALTIQQLVDSYTEEFAEMKETVDHFIAQIDGFDIQTYKEMQATLKRLDGVVLPDLSKKLNKLSGEYHEFVNTTYPQFIAGYVQFREAQLELNKGFEEVARDVSDGHGTFNSLNDRFVAEEATTKVFREAQAIRNTGYTNTSKEVVDARGTYPTLKDRLNVINKKDDTGWKPLQLQVPTTNEPSFISVYRQREGVTYIQIKATNITSANTVITTLPVNVIGQYPFPSTAITSDGKTGVFTVSLNGDIILTSAVGDNYLSTDVWHIKAEWLSVK